MTTKPISNAEAQLGVLVREARQEERAAMRVNVRRYEAIKE